MGNQLRQRDEPASLPPGEADLARRAVFAWTLLPAAARLTHEVRAVTTPVRLFDDVPAPAELTAEEAEVVCKAARIQLTHGLDPDAGARARIARGRADELPDRTGSLPRLLQRLERARG